MVAGINDHTVGVDYRIKIAFGHTSIAVANGRHSTVRLVKVKIFRTKIVQIIAGVHTIVRHRITDRRLAVRTARITEHNDVKGATVVIA